MANKHMKRYSTLLITREMQIRTTMKYYLTPVKMAIIINSTNKTCWNRCREKVTLLHSWWECKLVQPLQRTVWRILRKLEIELLYDTAVSLLSMYQYTDKTLIQKDTHTLIFIAALFTIVKTGNNSYIHQTDEWINKLY